MHRNRIHDARRITVWTGLFTVLVLAASPAMAQDRMRKHDPEEHLAKIQEELNLDAQQTEQIRAIFAERHAEFERLWAEEGGDRESRHEAIRQLHEETHAQIREVLNEEQRARFEELRAEHMERRGKRGHGHENHMPKDSPDNG